MKLITTTALALVAGAFAAPAAAQYGATAQQPQTVPAPAPAPAAQAPQASGGLMTHQPKLSSGAAKAIIDLQTAVNKNDAASVPAKLAAAKAAAKTGEDKYAIGILELKAASNEKNQAAQASALEDMLSSGSAQPNEQLSLYNALAQTYSNLKQPQKATEAYQHVIQLDPNNVDAIAGLAEAKIAAGQASAALPLLEQGIKAQQARGQKAPEAWYKRAVGVAYDAKLPTAAEFAREWVSAYPSSASWRDAIAIYRNLNHPDAAAEFDILRLARATDALQGTGDFHTYAYEAADEANYGEAKSLMAEGIASGKIKASDPIVQEIQGVLKAKATPSAAELATAEKAAREPNAFLRVGDRYYGAGNYAKAAELYRDALQKGVDKDLANLRLGEALARAGDKGGATAALNAVTGPRAEIAKFWLTYVNQRG